MAAIYKKLGYSADDIQSIENTVSGNVLTTKITLKSGEEITATAKLPQEEYTLPQATNTALGGVKMPSAASGQTEKAGITSDGYPVTKPIVKPDGVNVTLSGKNLNVEVELDNNTSVSGQADFSNLSESDIAFINLNSDNITASSLYPHYHDIESAAQEGKLVVLLFGDSGESEYERAIIERVDGMGMYLYFYSQRYYYTYQYYENKLTSVSLTETPVATTSAVGGIKAQSGSSDGQNFPVQVNSDGTAFINIPIYNGEVE